MDVKNELCSYPLILNPHKQTLKQQHIGKFCTVYHIYHITSTLTYNRISSSSCRWGSTEVTWLWAAVARWMSPLSHQPLPVPRASWTQWYHRHLCGWPGREKYPQSWHSVPKQPAARLVSWCQAMAPSIPLPTPGCFQPQATSPHRGLRSHHCSPTAAIHPPGQEGCCPQSHRAEYSCQILSPPARHSGDSKS